MKRHPDCYPCLVRQALNIARHCGANEHEQMAIVRESMAALLNDSEDLDERSAHFSIQNLIRQRVGDGDPYRALKDLSTRRALALYPALKELVLGSNDPFGTAVRLAIAGNIIDYGPADDYDLQASLEKVLSQTLAIDHIAAFREALRQATWLLYLADNAGETVFDRVLIEEIAVPITYAVKGGPAGNDATREDAVAAGLDRLVRITDNGANSAGTVLSRVSQEFRALYDSAEVIVSKGMGNYETLSTEGPRLFFLLQAKCIPVASDLGVPVGSLVVKQG